MKQGDDLKNIISIRDMCSLCMCRSNAEIDMADVCFEFQPFRYEAWLVIVLVLTNGSVVIQCR